MRKGKMTKAHKEKLAEGRRLAAKKRREGMLSTEEDLEQKKAKFQIIGYSFDGPVFSSERKTYVGKIYKSVADVKAALLTR